MKSPEISIIIPVYKVEKYLDRCIQSVLNQSFTDYEVILVDDGSPDSCPEMCDSYAASDSRFKVIHKKNQGLGFARNSGLDIAQGKYVMFLDSDDWYDPKICEILHKAIIESDAQLSLCGFNVSDGNKILSTNIGTHEQIIAGYSCLKRMLFGEGGILWMSVWHCMFSMDVINGFGLRFVSERQIISEDVSFLTDYLQVCKTVKLVNAPLYYYFKNNNSISTTYIPGRYEAIKVLVERIRRNVVCSKEPEWEQAIQTFFHTAVYDTISYISLLNRDNSSKELRSIQKDYISQAGFCQNSFKYLRTKQKLVLIIFKLRCIIIVKMIFRLKRCYFKYWYKRNN